ncbi:uncharacterized protein C8Q71DRAFT_749535 [Rhodofomes roseus]|uniref:DUF218 domain-containing protein n=1 Tax=Rhodofomes roseus TaxID=34475 RepID=A0ABQ8KML2_9APHY|nr:uncharacterized protein C8Q71DRAFT_749535 [Rhodofomes roseus]KAH9839441.1 hypothetical protein C8Q71DRAFT_749535 [Rhodofomes roseus]
MLPLPISSSRKRQLSRHGLRHPRSTKDVLLTRARVTNLGLVLLSSVTVLSLLFNLSYHFSSPDYLQLPPGRSPPSDILSTIQRHDALSTIDHLIMVPGHAVWKGTDVTRRLDDEEWILEPYQRGGGRVAAFYQHIAAGAELARQDAHALLVFSGGQTRPISTSTEAQSYMRLALAADLTPSLSVSGSRSHTALRATTEDYALDSFQNLLYSIARFHEYTGRYPSHITVIGYEFKRRRFTELHRAALRWPRERFHYIGIDAEGEELIKAQEGERLNGYLPYTVDTYGCHDMLLSKRRSRNPFIRFHSYHSSSPELAPLLNWCPGLLEGGQTAIYGDPLPWDAL